jgi:hypothetical protein
MCVCVCVCVLSMCVIVSCEMGNFTTINARVGEYRCSTYIPTNIYAIDVFIRSDVQVLEAATMGHEGEEDDAAVVSKEHFRDCPYFRELKRRAWRRQTRIDMTVHDMTLHKLRRVLAAMFSFVAVTAVLMLAVVQLPDIEGDESVTNYFDLLHNTSLPSAGSGLEYPTCGTSALTHVSRQDQSVRSLADFGFLASLAYVKVRVCVAMCVYVCV